MSAYTIGIDTGGTFTDSFVADGGGRHWTVKVPTTPHDLTVCFAEAIAQCAETVGLGLEALLRQTSVIRFSSTIGTNTILTRSGPKLGLLVTSGAERSLYGAGEDGRIFEFISPDMVAGLDERVDEEGRVEVPVDPDAVNLAVKDLLERGARILVVSLANSVLNPANERAVVQAIDASYPRHYLGAVPTLLSTQVSAVAGDGRRTVAAVVNAYTHKQLSLSLYKAEDDLRRRGFRHPLLVVAADGAVTRVAKTRALSTYQSGPAAGVHASALLARANDIEAAVTADVGGTSTDLGLAVRGRPLGRRRIEVAGLDVAQASVDILSIALGGGSVARVVDGQLLVGPESAAALPGPASFGLGGRNPTPTDAWLVLGYLDPGFYLGGRRQLRPEAAARALDERIGEPLGLSTEQAALAVAEAAEAAVVEGIEAMLARPSVQAALGGEANRPALVAYGGGGGILLPAVAMRLQVERTFLSSLAPVFSAFGVSTFDVRHRYEGRARLDGSESAAGMAEVAAALAEEAQRDVRGEGFDQDAATFSVALLDESGEPLLEEIGPERLEAELKALRLPSGTAALVSLTATCEVAKPGLPSATPSQGPDPAEAEKGRRDVLARGGRHPVPVYDGGLLRAGHRFRGPALVETAGTTSHVPEGVGCEIDPFGTAILTGGG